MYSIIRFYKDHPDKKEIIKQHLSYDEALTYLSDPETSSSFCTSQEALERTEKYGSWFDGYTTEI